MELVTLRAFEVTLVPVVSSVSPFKQLRSNPVTIFLHLLAFVSPLALYSLINDEHSPWSINCG
jgi:hypothetical protein